MLRMIENNYNREFRDLLKKVLNISNHKYNDSNGFYII